MSDSIMDALVSARYHLAELEREIDNLTALCTASQGEDTEWVLTSDALFAIVKSLWPKYPESAWSSIKVKLGIKAGLADSELSREDRKKIYKALNQRRDALVRQEKPPEPVPDTYVPEVTP